MRHAYVIGLGKSGIAAVRLLKREGWSVTASDSGHSDSLEQVRQELETEGIPVQLGTVPDLDPARVQRVVVSPGVRWDLPVLVQARDQGIEMMGEMELGWRSLSTYPWVAVTGTNGKTTTTALIAAIFQTAGLQAPACGNIGYAACDLALELEGQADSNSLDWVVAEVSSYQIESSSSLAPKIGVWTTFTPDHLSRHYTLENYYAIKAKLLQQSEFAIFNGDDPYLRSQSDQWSDAYWTSVIGKPGLINPPERGAYIQGGWAFALGESIVPVSTLRMVGNHNQQNLLMAVLASRLAGIAREAIAQAIEAFPGVPHRLEHVLTWQGINFINDSKATNYDAAEVGLAAVDSPVVLIAGGEAKEGDDSAWIRQIKDKAVSVLLIGSAAPAFAQRLNEAGYTAYEIVETMERAVQRGGEVATVAQAKVVLLSPACASFDQYANFEQRGDHFRQLCLEAYE